MRALWGWVVLAACGAPMAVEPPVADSGTGVPKRDAGVVSRADAGVASPDAGTRDAGVEIDAGTPGCAAAYNSVVNAGFECADLTPWDVSDGVGTVIEDGHTGLRSMQLVANARGLVGVGQNAVVADTQGDAYCARVWVHGTSPEMRLEVRASPSGKGTAFSSPVASDAWLKVPPGGAMVVSSMRGESLSILAKTQSADAGDVLVVDDFELWASPSGRCDEH